MLKKTKAVLFDLDGTLVDSMGMWHDIDVEYLSRFGLAMPPDLQQAIAGISVTQTAIYIKNRFKIEDSIEKIIGDWNDMAIDKYTHHVPLKNGVVDFLEYLNQSNITCAIATSNSKQLSQAVLKSRGIEKYFKTVITGQDIHNGKPEPDIYLEGAKRLEVIPDHCLVFEDVIQGIMAGKAAGMRVCAVEDDYSAKERLSKKELADYYIKDYTDILNQTYEEL